MLQYHELSNLFPMMSDDESKRLRDDIQANGLIEPIVLLDGKILDGRNRYQACIAVGVEPETVEFDGNDPLVYVVAKNYQRRHLSQSQLSMIALKVADTVSEKAHRNMRGGRSGKLSGKSIDTAETVSSMLGISRSLYVRAKQVSEERPDLVPLIESGQRTVGDAIKEIKREAREPVPSLKLKLGKSPQLIHADVLHNSVDIQADIIITSPPYNLGGTGETWPMGGDGRAVWEDGINYDGYGDDMPEPLYQEWQVSCFQAIYEMAKPGASFFYNHKIRQRNGGIIHPMDWIRSERNPWRLRQEIVWDRCSTHNHTDTLFWPQDERIYWMVKGDTPYLPNRPIGLPSVIKLFGPVPNTWHPAPFTKELPALILKAVGFDGCLVLDPFAGSCSTGVAASEFGYDSIMIDKSAAYLKKAAVQHGWDFGTKVL